MAEGTGEGGRGARVKQPVSPAPTTPHSGTKRGKSRSLETKSGAQTTEPQDPTGIGKPTGGGEGCGQITRIGGHFTCSQDTQGSTAHGIKL